VGGNSAISREPEGKRGAVGHGAAGELSQFLGDRFVGQHGVAPLVQGYLLREQLRAQAVAGAENRVDAQSLVHGQVQSSSEAGDSAGMGRNGSNETALHRPAS